MLTTMAVDTLEILDENKISSCHVGHSIEQLTKWPSGFSHSQDMREGNLKQKPFSLCKLVSRVTSNNEYSVYRNKLLGLAIMGKG